MQVKRRKNQKLHSAISFLYEVTSFGKTLEYSPLLSEAEVAYKEGHNVTLWKIYRHTGVKFKLKEKMSKLRTLSNGKLVEIVHESSY